ncbi:MAG: SRPBCC domain-containing protein [Pseudomonadota bacterium]
MTDTATELRTETSRVIAASKEALFDAWLDPAMLAKFMMPASDMTVPEVTTDPREGGRFRVVMRVGERDMPHEGTYKMIERPSRLAFTWESPFSSIEGSTVTLTFDDAPEGTKVTLTHVRFETEEMRDNHAKGWAAILDALAAVS